MAGGVHGGRDVRGEGVCRALWTALRCTGAESRQRGRQRYPLSFAPRLSAYGQLLKGTQPAVCMFTAGVSLVELRELMSLTVKSRE